MRPPGILVIHVFDRGPLDNIEDEDALKHLGKIEFNAKPHAIHCQQFIISADYFGFKRLLLCMCRQ